ncbi:putative serine threonine protein kinase [Diplodia seriata]|uniref:non-specific serine/threonine protein kinase n=1 Tax=Diplodia seriata TaxID=420778 RepID=A0A0G2GRW1_9PEZI|nr:putative serine threonine protein kinase [Diplodia seriata]
MVGSFRRMNQIGKGSFATVYKGVHIKKRELVVAIKSVDTTKLNKKLKDNLSTEIQILRNLTHPHIVALIDCKEVPKYIHIVTEFCELGDLSSFIKKRATLADHPATAHMMKKYPNPPVGGLNEVLCRHFLKQIASALEFIHAKNYVHRDLKPQNLLLNPSPLYYQTYRPNEVPYAAAADSMVPAVGIASLPMLKVADFGFARFLPKSSLAETLCGSPLYMAPEILRYEKYDAKADLWSTGTVLHEMLVGKPPFRASNHVELLRRIEKQDDRISFGEIPISRDMKNIVRALLKKTPTERISHEKFFCDVDIAFEQEALVLYVKALALLAKSIDLAGSWWGQRHRGEIIGDSHTSRTSGNANVAAVGTKMNQIVQWVRTRFNECVEKSEFVGRKLLEAQKLLPPDHPAHPNNLPSNSTSITSAGTSVENIHLPTGITAEKLMYDRAIEMSRAAAVNELVGEDLPGCELNYTTAIRMLEAIFESEEEMLGRKPGSRKQEDDVIQGLEEEDRASVLKLIEGLRARLKALRKKIEIQSILQ